MAQISFQSRGQRVYVDVPTMSSKRKKTMSIPKRSEIREVRERPMVRGRGGSRPARDEDEERNEDTAHQRHK